MIQNKPHGVEIDLYFGRDTQEHIQKTRWRMIAMRHSLSGWVASLSSDEQYEEGRSHDILLRPKMLSLLEKNKVKQLCQDKLDYLLPSKWNALNLLPRKSIFSHKSQQANVSYCNVHIKIYNYVKMPLHYFSFPTYHWLRLAPSHFVCLKVWF